MAMTCALIYNRLLINISGYVRLRRAESLVAMVVCMVVRVRNLSTRTFRLEIPADPFYKPSIDGLSCRASTVEVGPGFDAPCEA